MKRTFQPGVPRARVGSVGSGAAAALTRAALAALEGRTPARWGAEQTRADKLVPFIRP